MKVTPTGGTRAFRNRTSMAVDGGALVVTDRKGTERKFALNAGASSPARHVVVMSNTDGAFRDQWAILDGNGEALVLGYLGDWDSLERAEIDSAAGLTKSLEHSDAPRTEVRQDGLVLQDGTWWKWAPKAGMVAFVVAAITGAGALPAALGWPVAAALMIFLVVGMTSGAYGKHRQGKGAAAENAILADDRRALDTAAEEGRNPSRTSEGDPPEAAT